MSGAKVFQCVRRSLQLVRAAAWPSLIKASISFVVVRGSVRLSLRREGGGVGVVGAGGAFEAGCWRPHQRSERELALCCGGKLKQNTLKD